jgi:acyl-CoA synthetase (AMP-forming)/AMP-acid ligase II
MPSEDKNIGTLIARQASLNPERLYIVEPESLRTLTFGELDRLTKEIFLALSSHHLEKGDRVGLCFNNGISAALAFLTVVSNGVVAVPIGPLATQFELKRILDDCGAKFIICAQDLKEELIEKTSAVWLNLISRKFFPTRKGRYCV